MKNRSRLAQYIKSVRARRKETQTQFAKAVWPGEDAYLALCRIGKYETDRAIPPGDVLLKIQDLDKDN